jgi:hypothetical protein
MVSFSFPIAFIELLGPFVILYTLVDIDESSIRCHHQLTTSGDSAWHCGTITLIYQHESRDQGHSFGVKGL